MVDVVVVGGGPAGVTAALRARELGAEVALVERGNLGGVCTNDGCAPTHSDVWAMKGLPGSVAVVGGAATGCQLASVFAAFGSSVSLLEVAPRILAAEDEAVSEAVAKAFGRRGIEIVTGIG